MINSIPLSQIDILSWRDKIGYVGQDSFLLNDTIINNITFRDEKINLKKIEEVLRFSNLYDTFKPFPKGLQKFAGERGINLSGGQKQRVSMARSFFRNPSLLLMDEPTSALDNKTKKMLISTLEGLKKNITIVCITHDKDIMKISDKVINIKNN